MIRSDISAALAHGYRRDARVLAMTGDLGPEIVEALAEMVSTVDRLPGTFKAEFSLTYWAGVIEPAEAWSCTVEGDLLGDDGSTSFVLGKTAADALRTASIEAWRRVPPST